MTKPAIVLVPGLLCNRALFAPQVAAFRATHEVHVPRVTAFDSLQAMAAHVLAQSPDRFSLVGLSMGGYVAFEMLRQAPERVERLCLIDTNARADRPEQVAQRQLLIGLGRTLGVRAVQAMLLKYLVHSSRLTDADLVATVLGMAEDVGRPAFERQQAAIIARPDNRPFLGQIRCPTTVIVGAADIITPPKVAEEMHAGIGGSRLEVIPDCGHLATLEAPERVNRVLAD